MASLLTRRLLLGLSLLFLASSARFAHWLAVPAFGQSLLLALAVGLLACELLCLFKRAGRSRAAH